MTKNVLNDKQQVPCFCALRTAPVGFKNKDFLAVHKAIMAQIDDARFDVVVISLGFDALRGEPLGGGSVCTVLGVYYWCCGSDRMTLFLFLFTNLFFRHCQRQ